MRLILVTLEDPGFPEILLVLGFLGFLGFLEDRPEYK
jgi:hypothetical protein